MLFWWQHVVHMCATEAQVHFEPQEFMLKLVSLPAGDPNVAHPYMLYARDNEATKTPGVFPLQ
jgi:hypothetical protein